MRWLHAALILGLLFSGWLPATASAWAESDMMEAPPQAKGTASLSPRPAVATTGTSDTLLALSLAGAREIAQGEPLSLTLEAWNVGQTRIDGTVVRVTAEDEALHTRSMTVTLPSLAVDGKIIRAVTVTGLATPGRWRVRAVADEGLDAPTAAAYTLVVRQTQPDVWRPAPGAGTWRPGNGALEIVLPEGRDERIARLSHRALLGEDALGRKPLLAQFELQAEDAQGAALTELEAPLLLRWRYGEAMAEHLPIVPPRFMWWDAQARTWRPITTTVDAQAQVIEARVMKAGAYGIDEPVKEKVEDPFSGLEARLFTGSLHYRYPIPLFQRPGGFGPGLALSYDSRRRDANQKTGSFDFLVGWGWRLDGLGYINYEADSTYKLALNGATYTVKKGASWNWYAEEAPWLKITRASSDQTADWHVRTPDGTHYIFKQQLTYWDCQRNKSQAKRFLLSSITAAADDGTWAYSMNVHYATDSRNAKTATCGIHSYVYQAWPTSITYNGVSGHTLTVTFGYATDRDDRPAGCASPACTNTDTGFLYFYTRNLTDITLKVDGRVARRYHLNAHVTQNGNNFHDHRLLLDSIQVYGKDNAGPRPAVTFSYRHPESCNFQENCRLGIAAVKRGVEEEP